MSKKKRKQWDVAVIGAGASGMMAAITAARRGLSVLVLEHMDKPGKKILATGNGKCNYTNLDMQTSHYHGNTELIQSVLKKFGVSDTLSFFREIGIWPKARNGYVYPNSGQAASVAEALSAEMRRCNVTLQTSCILQSIQETRYGFEIITSEERMTAKNVILAVGLLASSRLGSDGSLFSVIKAFGHRFTPILPALCGFEASGMAFPKVSGVRTDVSLALYIEKELTETVRGELQLADYGVSGIPVFQLSSEAVRGLHQKKEVTMTINFLPDFSAGELKTELKRRFQRDAGIQTAADSLRGLCSHKLIPVLLKKANISGASDSGEISQKEINSLAFIMQAYPITLNKVRDFAFAQVCTGGIRTEEIHIDTLESRIVPGLYFAGELLDADGICGGYNLQWAWASGFTAGSAVGTYD